MTAAIKKILCPVDFLQQSAMVAEYASMMAKALDAEIEVLYVSFILTDIGGHHEVEPAQIQEVEKELFTSSSTNMDTFIKQHFSGVKAKGKVLQGYPADEILKHIKESGADLVIMGTQGRKGFNRLFFGSVAEKVVRLSPAPVLTIRASE
jgi:nucleotide-binding universal stress UspA family protein